MKLNNLLQRAIFTAVLAGKEIIKIYDSKFQVDYKNDKSPLTTADKNANKIIESNLKSLNIPILSEEGKFISYKQRKSWKYFWLIDPLDGTKEFINRNGEFTVNIALIDKNKPILGVVYVPVSKLLYFGTKDIGSHKIDLSLLQENFDILKSDVITLTSMSNKLPIFKSRDIYTVVGSRSHMSIETEIFLKEKKDLHDDIKVLSVGSSLKLCMVAEGKADIYPRYAPTMEWDTGAGHAIVKYAGFSVIKYNSNDELIYNKEDLLNPWFVVE